jgi:hypothetical protein
MCEEQFVIGLKMFIRNARSPKNGKGQDRAQKFTGVLIGWENEILNNSQQMIQHYRPLTI